MNEDSLFLKPFMKENDFDSALIILKGKQNELKNLLTDMIKNYNKAITMNFPNNMIMPRDDMPFDDWNQLQITDYDGIEALDIKPTLRLGSTGPYVIELQRILTNLLYYTGTISGNFDTSTEKAVKSFQTNNRLLADGVVGRDTWSALSSLYSPLAICEEEPGNDYFLYTVVAGDSLWQIARRFGTTVDAIKRLNGLTSDNLSIGQVLRIPRESNEPDYTLYTVVRGDSLWQIARRFGTTVDAIKSLNGLTSNNLSIGQILRIPNR